MAAQLLLHFGLAGDHILPKLLFSIPVSLLLVLCSHIRSYSPSGQLGRGAEGQGLARVSLPRAGGFRENDHLFGENEQLQ